MIEEEYHYMTIEDLIETISQLEKRIIQLELQLSKNNVRDEDAWYWDH